MDIQNYAKLKPGDAFDSMPRPVWNKLIDMLEWYDRTIALASTSQDKPPPFRACNAIRIKNATEADLDKGSIVAIDGSVYDPGNTKQLPFFKASPILIGTTPAIPADIGRFAVLVEPIRNGKIGYAAIDGVVACKVDMAYQGHKFADIEGSETGKLVSHEYGGAEILYVEDMNEDPGTWTAGVKEAIVRIGAFNEPLLMGVLDAQLTGSSSATMTLIGDGTGSGIDPGGRVVTIEGGIIGGNDPTSGTLTPTYVVAFFHRPSGTYQLVSGTDCWAGARPWEYP